jgi:hypothetical protein
MNYISIDLQNALAKLFDIEEWELEDRCQKEGGIILNLENITKLKTILEEKAYEDIKQEKIRRNNFVCEMGYPECNRRGVCDGSC